MAAARAAASWAPGASTLLGTRLVYPSVTGRYSPEIAPLFTLMRH
ncbi:MAG: hypothetical protein QOJ73_1023 [Streptosporangiaceae bacterium]|jgi:hypothetical protein|nr:hypothetical protein [Streptosporangiaceae bacterium]